MQLTTAGSPPKTAALLVSDILPMPKTGGISNYITVLCRLIIVDLLFCAKSLQCSLWYGDMICVDFSVSFLCI